MTEEQKETLSKKIAESKLASDCSCDCDSKEGSSTCPTAPEGTVIEGLPLPPSIELVPRAAGSMALSKLAIDLSVLDLLGKEVEIGNIDLRGVLKNYDGQRACITLTRTPVKGRDVIIWLGAGVTISEIPQVQESESD